MQLKSCLRTLGLLAVLGLAGFGGACSPGSQSTVQEKSDQIRESNKAAHQQAKADARKIQADVKNQQGAQRKGAHRGPA
jgi:hypothetical protein